MYEDLGQCYMVSEQTLVRSHLVLHIYHFWFTIYLILPNHSFPIDIERVPKGSVYESNI